MRRRISFTFLLSILLCLIASSISADKVLKILVHKFKPCVIENTDGSFSGSDIDLWYHIAQNNSWAYEFVKVSNLDQMLKMIENGEGDVAIAGISKTFERERRVDFTDHYQDSGLVIMINAPGYTFSGLIKRLTSWEMCRIMYIWIIYVLIAAFVIWSMEYGKPNFNDDWRIGFPEAIYFVVVTMSTVGYGDFTPMTWKGRVSTIFLIISGLGYFSIILAQLIALFQDPTYDYPIQSYHDLRGKVVVTKAGTTSVKILEDLGAEVVSVEKSIEPGFAMLENGKVDAVVFDKPPLVRYAQKDGKGKVVIVGKVFNPQYYGFALQAGSHLREDINLSIHKARESGVLKNISERWYGADY